MSKRRKFTAEFKSDEVYTQKRIHSALSYLTPAEYEANWLARQPELMLQ